MKGPSEKGDLKFHVSKHFLVFLVFPMPLGTWVEFKVHPYHVLTHTCVSVVVCVVRKPRPCPSYSRRRDRINLGLLRSYYKGGGGALGCAL